MSKRSKHTVTWVGAGIVLASLCLVLSALFAPQLTAMRALRQTTRALANVSEFSHLTVFDPLDHSGPLLPTDAEVRLTDTAQIGDVRDRLLDFLRGAKYSGIAEAMSGNWDVRARFVADGEMLDLYLGEDQIYLSREGRQYLFTPKDAAGYVAWRELWLTSLFGETE